MYEHLHDIYPYDTRYMSTNMIYSKYHLCNKVYLSCLNGGSSYIVECTVSMKGDSVKLYGCHLSSNNYSSSMEYITPSDVNSYNDMKYYLSNIDKASRLRELEANTIVGSFSEHDNVIVMGDMNDVCGSPSLRKFTSEGLNDAWSEGGIGYGATIHSPLPYRIDHILYNDGLKLKGVKIIDTSGISDHSALVAVFDLK